MADYTIRPTDTRDKDWIASFLAEQWGSSIVVSRGQAWDTSHLPGYIAEMDGKAVGLMTYRLDADEAELVTMNVMAEGRGIGAALIREMIATARGAGCLRLWLITTNDNTRALRFYQKNGFVLAALHKNALEESRKIKPQIPLVGFDGIPLRDEIELEIML